MSSPFATPTRSAALEDLLTRAGASDQDYEAWKAERRGGVTATEVRDLYLARQSSEGAYLRAIQDLVDLKLGRREDAFVDNQYTAWGRKREPIIADAIAWAHGIDDEHRVFRAADNPRKLASPDGIGVAGGDLRISEIKTGKYAMPPGSDALRKKGYVAQMVWGMRVTGARRCLYRWEQHNDDWVEVGERFREPSAILQTHEHWIEYDEALAAELDAIADQFLAEVDRQRAGGGPVNSPDDYEVLVNAYLAADAAAARAKARAEDLKAQIAERIGGQEGFKVTTTQAHVTWVTSKPRRVFDEAAWAKKAPAQHRAFVAAKEKYTREGAAPTPYVKITALDKEIEA